MMRYSLIFLLFFVSSAFSAVFEEGEHYLLIPEDQQFTLSKKQEVVEFFYYGCPHCYNIHPLFETWIDDRKPAGTDVHFIPAYFSERWSWSAKLFAVAKALKKDRDVHDAIFQKQFKGGGIKSRQDIYDLFATVGVEQELVDKEYNGFVVSNLMSRYKKLTHQSTIQGVPAFVVQGKYLVSSRSAGSVEGIFDVIDYLLVSQ